MSQENRITSLAQLGELKGDMDLIKTTQPTEEHPVAINESKFANRPKAARPAKTPNEQQNAPKKKFGNNRPPVDQVMRTIQQTLRPEGQLPSLEDFIMELQNHIFSFSMYHRNQLHKFVEAQSVEARFHKIAWAGGDEYMLALMMYMNYAVTDIVALRTKHLDINAHIHKQKPQSVKTEAVGAVEEPKPETGVTETNGNVD